MENIGIIVFTIVAIIFNIIVKRSNVQRFDAHDKRNRNRIDSASQEALKRSSSKQKEAALRNASFHEQKEAMNDAYQQLLLQWKEAGNAAQKGLLAGTHAAKHDQRAESPKRLGGKRKSVLPEESSKKKSKIFLAEQPLDVVVEEASPEGSSLMEAYREERPRIGSDLTKADSARPAACGREPENFLEMIQSDRGDKDREMRMWRRAILMNEILQKPLSLRKG